MFELLLGIAFIIFSCIFVAKWYFYIFSGVRLRRNTLVRTALGFMPLLAFIIILYTLLSLASFDVEGVWVFFYLVFGYAWLYFGMFLMFYFFDLSWMDDALNNNNPAAALAIAGGGLGITLIYAGANIGDGPGWWCVLFAGGLGMIAWYALGLLINAATGVLKRITVERDVFCGARTGAYFLSSGIILGRASAGDWTSFGQTIVEFGDGWPVLLLAAVFILIELVFKAVSNPEGHYSKGSRLFITVVLCAVYIAAMIYIIGLLPPLPQNPIY